ncbi:hypothetical protein Tco_0907536 [Tanacetum coccineum]|uniref:Uncharacterized protein n=1 Tax=Tanacetum coccineum TaxID=301880 RepID=A0ABQ5CJJ5_9ASTR
MGRIGSKWVARLGMVLRGFKAWILLMIYSLWLLGTSEQVCCDGEYRIRMKLVGGAISDDKRVNGGSFRTKQGSKELGKLLLVVVA